MLDRGTREDAERAAHGLKGIAGSLAVDHVYRTAASLEAAIKSNNDADTAAALASAAAVSASLFDLIAASNEAAVR